MRTLLSLLLVTILIASVLGSGELAKKKKCTPLTDYEDPDCVFEDVNPSNFKKFMKSNKEAFLLILTPDCCKCKSSFPDILGAARFFEGEVTSGKMMSTQLDMDMFGFLKPNLFPAMFYFKNGKLFDTYPSYGRKKDQQAIVSWIKRRYQPTKVLTSQRKINMFNSTPGRIIAWVNPTFKENNEFYAQFLKLATDWRMADFQFGEINSMSLWPWGVQHDTMELYNADWDEIHTFDSHLAAGRSGIFDLEEAIDWIYKNHRGNFYDSKNVEDVLLRKADVLLLCQDPTENKKENRRLRKWFYSLADDQDFRKYSLLTNWDAKKKTYLDDFSDCAKVDLPAVLILNQAREYHKFPADPPAVTNTTVLNFIKRYEEGKTKPVPLKKKGEEVVVQEPVDPLSFLSGMAGGAAPEAPAANEKPKASEKKADKKPGNIAGNIDVASMFDPPSDLH